MTVPVLPGASQMRATAIVASLLVTCLASAQPQPVHVLERTEHFVTLGNDAFSVKVERTGKISDITANGRQYVWLLTLYTTPVTFDTGKGLRAVQGETSPGGIGPVPELPEPELRGDCYVLTISRDCSREEIYGGQPLYHLTQTIEVHPEGYLHLRYEFDWLRFFVMSSATLNVVLNAEQFTGRTFWADYGGYVSQGSFTEGADYSRHEGLRGALRTLEVACDAGPFHLWVERGEQVSGSRWGSTKYYPVGLAVPKAGRRAEIYPGTHSVLELSIKLPVANGG